jgi:hypothetical protein
MKLTEVVLQLQAILPKFTDYFSETISVTSIIASGGVAVINAVGHLLLNGKPVTISDVAINNVIDSVSQDGLIFTYTTVLTHDLSLDFPGYENVVLGGFTDGSWNNSFKLIDVPNGNTFKVQSTNILPTLNGNEYLTEVRADGINGRFAATVIDADHFSVSGDFLDGDYSTGTVKKSVRIAGSVTIERALEQYTEQLEDDLWMFVTMSDATVSKNRNALNDATATITSGEDIRTRIIDGFSVFIVKNTTDEIAAVESLDIARHDLLNPITKTLFGARFSTGLFDSGDFVTILTGHNFVEYTKATFVYQYNFEFVNDMTQNDAVDVEDTKAFREIDYTHSIGGDDTTDMTFEGEIP